MKDRKHMAAVAALGCIIPGCGKPAVPHHITGVQHRGMGQKACDRKTIPLCPMHHTTGGPGVALHACEETWEANFGSQEYHLERTLRLLNLMKEMNRE